MGSTLQVVNSKVRQHEGGKTNCIAFCSTFWIRSREWMCRDGNPSVASKHTYKRNQVRKASRPFSMKISADTLSEENLEQTAEQNKIYLQHKSERKESKTEIRDMLLNPYEQGGHTNTRECHFQDNFHELKLVNP